MRMQAAKYIHKVSPVLFVVIVCILCPVDGGTHGAGRGNQGNLVDYMVQGAGKFVEADPMNQATTGMWDGVWQTAVKVLQGAQKFKAHVIGTTPKNKVQVIDLNSSHTQKRLQASTSRRMALLQQKRQEQQRRDRDQLERQLTSTSATTGGPPAGTQAHNAARHGSIHLLQTVQVEINPYIVPGPPNPLTADGEIPKSEYNSSYCDNVGYMWVFPQPEYTCDGISVNQTTFETRCPTAIGLTDTDFSSTAARTNWATVCGCTRSKAYSRVCVCPRDRKGLFCQAARKVTCRLELANDPPCNIYQPSSSGSGSTPTPTPSSSANVANGTLALLQTNSSTASTENSTVLTPEASSSPSSKPSATATPTPTPSPTPIPQVIRYLPNGEPNYTNTLLDVDKPCRPVKVDELYTLSPKFTCAFEDAEYIEEGINIPASQSLLRRPENITQADLDRIHAGFQYWVDYQSPTLNFSVAITPRFREYSTQFAVYDLETYQKHSFKKDVWSPAHAVGLTYPNFTTSVRENLAHVRGHRLYIEVGAPIEALPSGVKRPVWRRVFLDPTDLPLPPPRVDRLSAGEIVGIVFGALIGLALVVAAAGFVWWKRAQSKKTDHMSSLDFGRKKKD